MDITVRFIPIDQGVYKGKQFTYGNRPALCFDDGKQGYAIINSDEAVEVTSISLALLRSSRLVRGTSDKEESYDPNLFAEHILSFQRFKPIRPNVHKFLKFLQDPTEIEPQVETTLEKKPDPKPTSKSEKPGKNLIQAIAQELKLEPSKLRKLLRAKGLKAPYTDESLIRKTIGDNT